MEAEILPKLKELFMAFGNSNDVVLKKIFSIFAASAFTCSLSFAAQETIKKTTSTSTDSSMSTGTPPSNTGMNTELQSDLTEEAQPVTSYTDTSTSTTVEESMNKENKRAGFFLEPALVVGESDNDVRSYGLGVRPGFHVNETFFLGADARYQKSRMESATYGEVDGSGWNLGPTLGFQAARAGLRGWGTAILAGNYDPDAGLNGVNASYSEPRGYRAGVGVRIASVSLNAEYEELDYEKVTIDNGASTGFDTDDRSYLLSLSFPVQM
jgi:hypothetical protein